MEESVGLTIEKIKLQEQGKEAKLKERREHEATVSSLERAIRETFQQVDKCEEDQVQLQKKVDSLRADVVLARTRRDAICDQVQSCSKELEKLRATSNTDIAKVWELRSTLCQAVQEVADDCDVRALLIKPLQTKFPSAPIKKAKIVDESHVSLCETRLRAALSRKEKAINEKDNLMTEPEFGAEFIRYKNALQYSLQMINKLGN